MFLLAAFIIAATLIALRISIKTPTIQEQIKLLEITLENNIANNFQEELKNSVKFSIDKKTNITTNVFDFANFTERKASELSMDFELLFVGSLTNISNNYLNVSVINMLNKPINVSLNLSNGTVQTANSEIADSTRWDMNFTFNPGSNYNLTVSYNSTYTENVTIKTKSNRDIYVSFFDVTFKTFEAVYKNKTQERYTLH